MQFLYSAFSLPSKLAQSAVHIITSGRPVTSITCSIPWGIHPLAQFKAPQVIQVQLPSVYWQVL